MKYVILFCLISFCRDLHSQIIDNRLDYLVNSSDNIIRAKCISREFKWIDDFRGNHIYTFAFLEVRESLKGDNNKILCIELMGGKVGDITEVVTGQVTLNINEEILLFFKNTENMNQFDLLAKYPIQNGTLCYKMNEMPLNVFFSVIKQIQQNIGNPVIQKKIAMDLEEFKISKSIFNINAKPYIESIMPNEASGGTGTKITIKGSNFTISDNDNFNWIFFSYKSGGSFFADPIEWMDNKIVCEVPNTDTWDFNASSGPVSINNGLNRSNSINFHITFSYRKVKWSINPATVTFSVNENCNQTSDEKNAIIRAAETWNQSGSKFSFRYTGTSGATKSGKNGKNEITFGNASSGVIAFTSFWYDKNEMIEADMVFNSNLKWSTTNSSSAFDIETIALHEFGHWFVLNDLYGERDKQKTMYGFGETGEIKRSLSVYDKEGIQYIYGKITEITLTSKVSRSYHGYILKQNYPNPFNASTKISYQIYHPEEITIKIVDFIGYEVKTLFSGFRVPGNYELTLNASEFPSGVYFVKLQTNDYMESLKIALVK